MAYSKDVKVKMQAKVLHDYYGFPIPLVAAIQGVTRATARYRYDSITSEIGIYPDTASLYQDYLNGIERCKRPLLPAVALKNSLA